MAPYAWNMVHAMGQVALGALQVGRHRDAPGPQHTTMSIVSVTSWHHVHHHLIHCLLWKVAFCDMWFSTWGPWQEYVTKWWSHATLEDLHHMLCLHIPESLWRNLLPGYGADFPPRGVPTMAIAHHAPQ